MDPRGISVPAASVRYELGPYADDFNRKLMRLFSGQVLYACGMTANQLGDWFEYIVTTQPWGLAVMGDDVLYLHQTADGWQAQSLDISRFDMHVRRCHLRHGFKLMRALRCEHLARSMRRLSWTRSYIIRAEHQDGRAILPATMASGDPTTISANSTTTITIGYYAIRNSQPLVEVFHRAGFVCTGGTQPALSPHWDFLQKLFYPCAYGSSTAFLPAPKIGRFASRAFWTRAAVNHSSLAYAKGVCLGLERDFHHVPIARAIVARVLHLATDLNPEFDPTELKEMEWKSMADTPAACTDDTMAFVCERYDITPLQIHNIEAHISTWVWGKFLDDCEYEAWSSILAVDLS
jgi:hypothetical protein